MIEFDADTEQGDFELAVRFSSNAAVTALFGASGAGKTTVLRLIAGLAKPTRGRLLVGDTVFFDTTTKVFLPIHKRRVGVVFQDGTLFPHLTVAQNLAFGGWFAPPDALLPTRDAVVQSLGIGGLLNRRPARLSGGERQRVALARALLSAPSLLLMDEPLASVDQDRKLEIIQLIERVRDEFQVPIIYVSHARAEVMRLATHAVILKNGRVTTSGPPASILSGPVDTLF